MTLSDKRFARNFVGDDEYFTTIAENTQQFNSNIQEEDEDDNERD